ncbi:NAD(P)-dependent oxidoreductase [Chryseolinea lacunae]|uniref:NAD(P)-dependent oxidoreductase n=1 Tax=Chryseolinea lacunae TaxID=2801331 RepID=A0ABS1KW25_9BACT|nr:NAD(P)-dependent oxidoreductase [Chryseolinea lacunae]MBL0743569.1 NAD(P)-dependent oxidoreductase [Chryseolinea lacunae]
MKIALIGATGFVGTKILKEALQRGHQVTAIARDISKIQTQHANLTAKAGNVRNEDEVAALVKGHDVVVSAYNPGWTNPEIYSEFLAGSQSIQRGVKKANVKRLLVVGGAGSLEIAPGLQLVDTPEFPAEYKAGAQGARDFLNILRKEDQLDWTFLSPAILMHPGITDGRTGKYRTGTDQPVFNAQGESRLSVEDLSVAIVDELENKNFIRQRFTAAY